MSICEVGGRGSEKLKKCLPPSPAVLWFVNVCERKPDRKKNYQQEKRRTCLAMRLFMLKTERWTSPYQIWSFLREYKCFLAVNYCHKEIYLKRNRVPGCAKALWGVRFVISTSIVAGWFLLRKMIRHEILFYLFIFEKSILKSCRSICGRVCFVKKVGL